MKIEKGLLYTKDHEWVKVDGDTALVGITDYAQSHLGDIVFVELPDVDDEFAKGDEFAVIESVKAASDSYLPVSGTILEANEALDDEPGLLNVDCFANWIVKVQLSDKSELDGLLDADAYESLCGEEA